MVRVTERNEYPNLAEWLCINLPEGYSARPGADEYTTTYRIVYRGTSIAMLWMSEAHLYDDAHRDTFLHLMEKYQTKYSPRSEPRLVIVKGAE